ncbi:MAG: DUF992 domain-containing protein [Pseudomonadota bacterium]
MRTLILAFTMAAVAFAAAPASAAGTVRIGTLVCHIDGGAGFIVASRKTLTCEFFNLTGRDEFYDGSITKIGIDAGLTAGSRLVWGVFAPASRRGGGLLEGRYFGLTAEATPVVGLGANILVGGFDQSVNLQPLSIQGQLGVNIAAGIAAMRLKAPRVVRKH